MFSRTGRRIVLTSALAAVALAISACGGSSDGSSASTTPQQTSAGSASPAAAEGVEFNLTPEQNRVSTPKVDAIAAEVPQAIRDRGTLLVTGSAGTAPPLRFYATDDTTLIGSEVDFAYLIGDVLGLDVEISTADWAQNFVRIDSGEVDAFISTVTVTEERKEKYDFASYRVDSLAFEAKAGSDIVVNGPADVAGLKVAVGSGTNQEQILLAWDEENKAAGLEPAEISYYQNEADFLLALDSGRIDLYFGPSPSASYRHETTGKTDIVGVVPGGGDIPAQIAAMTLKDSGLAAPIAAALNHVIESGAYGDVLAKWGLDVEAIDASEVNPPGLPAS
jgi:polar amino acid transport system substrate-binding protein